jgi:hypothetical protein
VIGYYVHHHGSGHLSRASALAKAVQRPVWGLSSLDEPPGWSGEWLRLTRDDAGGPPHLPTARGRLHWAPVLDPGLATRWHEMSCWIATHRPEAIVVDVSVEAALLARLHGIPVVGFVLPGRRDDPAHLLGYDICDELVGAWPPDAGDMVPAMPRHVADRIRPIGAVSRHPVRQPTDRLPGPPRVVVMTGSGGHGISADRLAGAQAQTPDWEWTVLSRELGTWMRDPRRVLEDADVVVTHTGQGAIADVAAARTPAVVIPQARPFDEQATTARALAAGWPVLVEPDFPAEGWEARLCRAANLDGQRWQGWCDGRAAARFAALIDRVTAAGAPP